MYLKYIHLKAQKQTLKQVGGKGQRPSRGSREKERKGTKEGGGRKTFFLLVALQNVEGFRALVLCSNWWCILSLFF